MSTWVIVPICLAIHFILGMVFYVICGVKSRMTDRYIPDGTLDKDDWKLFAHVGFFVWEFVILCMCAYRLAYYTYRCLVYVVSPFVGLVDRLDRLSERVHDMIMKRKHDKILRGAQLKEESLTKPVEPTRTYRDVERKYNSGTFGVGPM